MKYILGIDLGTSYFKFGIFDENLGLRGIGRVEVRKDAGGGNLCELAPEKFQYLLKKGIAEACTAARAGSESISAVGYSSQANSFLLLDGHDHPLTPLILWPDRRCTEIFPEIIELWNEKDFQATTGIGIGPSASSCVNKLLWFKRYRPEIWSRVKSVATISDYLVGLFTGEKLGDVGTASLLGLLDCGKCCWWEKGFDRLGLKKDLFAPRLRPGSSAGRTTKSAADLTGIREGTPFFLGSLDHHMAALGAGLGRPNEIAESTGTVLAAVSFADKYMPKKGICVSPWTRPGLYCRLAFSNNGAAALEWYRKNFAPEYSVAQLIEMAERENSSGGLAASPNASACGNLHEAFAGVSGKHSHGHVTFALMESITNTLKELVDRICPECKPAKVMSTGGGAGSSFWLNMKSGLIGVPFVASESVEMACRGAAMITGSAD